MSFAWHVFHAAWAQVTVSTAKNAATQEPACCQSRSTGFRPNSGIVSDQVVLQHVGGEGRVFSFVALAMPDHLHKLFSLMCFQCPTPVASNVWLPLPHGFKVARPQTCSRKSLLWHSQVR
ncbi:unnamed protein product [Effrenium voratum]|nr:unnamed protein product [Effrenium voratum]